MTIDSGDWHPSRDAALRRLDEFSAGAGRLYAVRRNHDNGRGKHTAVSRLSPWLRHRCLGEWEVVRKVLTQHSLSAAEKYIQEVCWRTYWKGWLEMHPGVWDQYQLEIQSFYQQPDVMESIESAIRGNTGIDCFDDWCGELIDTGYLHNHARMWFASIWIFTLKLPWQLGADFFMRHLLDGDPAANTLSWRWVAGLHTRGKTYLARPDNIAKYTGNRFTMATALATSAVPIVEEPVYAIRPLPHADDRVPDGGNGLLVLDDDLHPEPLPGGDDYQAIAGVTTRGLASPGVTASCVIGFSHALLQETLSGIGSETVHDCHTDDDLGVVTDAIVLWASSAGLERVVCAYPAVGPNALLVKRLQGALSSLGIRLVVVRREWDSRFWPHAGKGFFALKKKIPQLLQPIIDEVSGQRPLF